MRVNGSASGVTWASAQARSAEVRGYPGLASQGGGWFGSHVRRMSSNLANLPMFRQSSWAEKEKLGRGRYPSQLQNAAKSFLRILWRLRLRIALVLTIILVPILFYATRKSDVYYALLAIYILIPPSAAPHLPKVYMGRWRK